MAPAVKYPAVYGALSGVIIVLVLILGIVLKDHARFIGTEWFGYLVMLVALTFIFLGVKRYRDVECGGVVKFLPAFGMGLAIALVASLVYVAAWEAYLALTHYTFMDQYIAGLIRAQKAAGVSGAALAHKIAELQTMRIEYANPLFRLPMTFIEIFPVGFLVALVSAALLRNTRFLPASR